MFPTGVADEDPRLYLILRQATPARQNIFILLGYNPYLHSNNLHRNMEQLSSRFVHTVIAVTCVYIL